MFFCFLLFGKDGKHEDLLKVLRPKKIVGLCVYVFRNPFFSMVGL